ncbi:MAG: cation transporter dimerization domain-containing protein, partial [Nitrososphaera sp.]
AIGVLLMAFAFFLARENRGLLLGESISGDESRRIRELVKTVPEVRDLVQMRTMHLGTHDVIVSIEVSLVDGLDTGRVAAATDEIEQRVRQVLPYAKQEHIFIEVQKHDPLL